MSGEQAKMDALMGTLSAAFSGSLLDAMMFVREFAPLADTIGVAYDKQAVFEAVGRFVPDADAYFKSIGSNRGRSVSAYEDVIRRNKNISEAELNGMGLGVLANIRSALDLNKPDGFGAGLVHPICGEFAKCFIAITNRGLVTP